MDFLSDRYFNQLDHTFSKWFVGSNPHARAVLIMGFKILIMVGIPVTLQQTETLHVIINKR